MGHEDRQQFAGICDKISDVLGRFIDDEGQDRRQSINLCARLKEYVEPIEALSHGRLPEAEINRLATTLDRVCDTWDEWKERQGKAEASLHLDSRDLDQLAEAKGMFEGLADRLRAM
jgi:hypothetical protein